MNLLGLGTGFKMSVPVRSLDQPMTVWAMNQFKGERKIE